MQAFHTKIFLAFVHTAWINDTTANVTKPICGNALDILPYRWRGGGERGNEAMVARTEPAQIHL